MKYQNLYKLFTKEDNFNIHKIFGFGSLLHYIYRCFHYFFYGNLGFDNSNTTLFLIIMHFCLSSSSLIFKIPSNRIYKSPMIWPEFRLHSIIFANRSLFTMILFWYQMHFPLYTNYFNILRYCLTIFTIYCADAATNYYKALLKPGESTMRTMGYPENTPGYFKKLLNFFYGTSQVFATMNIVFAKSMELPFLVLFPIQLAALLMTLVRKNIITTSDWHLYYTTSILLNYVYSIITDNRSHSEYYIGISFYFIVFRFALNFNKYILWGSICAFSAIKDLLN
jgi:hypothetical protein